MHERDARFAGSIPAIYDELFVPLLFEAPAEDLARRVAAGNPRPSSRSPPAPAR